MTERVGRGIDKGFERASVEAGLEQDPQLQAREEALQDLFAALPAESKTGELPVSLMAKLAGASGL